MVAFFSLIPTPQISLMLEFCSEAYYYLDKCLKNANNLTKQSKL